MRLVQRPTQQFQPRSRLSPTSALIGKGLAPARLRRPEQLVAAVSCVDSASSAETMQELAGWLDGLRADGDCAIPLGLMATCYLGGAFVDHRLVLTGAIVEHFKRDDTPPGAWAEARPLVRSGAYAYVEVYDDGRLVPIRADGSAVS